ncbi:MAG: Fe-S-containing hydro-lyase [Desulfobacterota bacterium]|nr:Fe-S-containing hydro-lyase [Thermodesulfobacteriota bacterium]MDW8001333.1 Fe-S-containing hydro-lyase [Deltaproteobacteria bacterium]
MAEKKMIETPLTDEIVSDLHAGDRVYLSGKIFTARDAAHARFAQLISRGEELPVDLSGQVVYYCGPTPTPPGKVIGSCGPTTSSRMDTYTPMLLARGLKGMIGKGKRSEEVKKAIVHYKAVYFAALGGAGALLSKSVVTSKLVAFEDLGPEAIYVFEVKEMPLVVINDIYGRDLYEEGIRKFRVVD